MRAFSFEKKAWKNLSNLRIRKRKTNNAYNQRKHVDRGDNSIRIKEKRQSNNFERIWRKEADE